MQVRYSGRYYEQEVLVSEFSVTPSDLISAVLSDIARPSFKGFYQMVFEAYNPFFPEKYTILPLKVTDDGKPMIQYPENTPTRDDFLRSLTTHIQQSPTQYRAAAVMLVKQDEGTGEVLDSWAWNIEPNGHMTPVTLDGEGGITFNRGWTVNHNGEVMNALTEALRILETSVEKAVEKNLDKFNVTLTIDGERIGVHAKTTSEKGLEFALDREDYPEMFLAFKNAAYVASDAYVLVTLGDEVYRWEPVGGVLTGVGGEHEQEGWDIAVDEAEAKQLMDHLTKEASENPAMDTEPRQSLATDEQAAFFAKFIPEETVGAQHLMSVFSIPRDGSTGFKYSTRISKLKEGYVIEIPEVLNYLMSDPTEEYRVHVILQSLLNYKEHNRPRFDYYGWEMKPGGEIEVMSNNDIARFVDLN